MLKNSLSNYLLIFAAGFLACFIILKGNFCGARVENPSTIKVEEAETRIDSLVILEKVSETKVIGIKSRKQINKKNYEKDTSFVNSSSFDSLAILFSEYYPSK